MKGSFVGRVLRAKATVFVGLAMILAVVLGAASTAQAHVGDRIMFHLNHANTVSTVLTKLVGNVAGPILTIDNDGSGSALDLQVEPGKAPMTVSALSGTATNLSADKLDGQNSTAFLKSRIYTIGGETEQFGVLLPDGTRRLEAHCKPGDLPLGGGPANINSDTRVLNSFPELRFSPPGWVVTIKNANDELLPDKWSVVVLCADQ